MDSIRPYGLWVSNTNFSPYELLFGRKMKNNANWEPPIKNDLEDAILTRTTKIKKMVEYDHPAVVDAANQEKPKIIQNSAS